MSVKKNSILCVAFLGILALSVFAAKKVVVHVIDQALCTQCGKCVKACKENAVTVVTKDGKKTHLIDPALCNQCGDCIEVCKEDAILAVEKKKEPPLKPTGK